MIAMFNNKKKGNLFLVHKTKKSFDRKNLEIGTVMIGTTLKDKKSIILSAREFVNENRKESFLT